MNPFPFSAKQNVNARALFLADRLDLKALEIVISLTELARLHLF